MKETIRCCIACILPCGALDVVRIVHANGRVEEISGTVSAGEIMRAYPKHVLRRPRPTCHVDGGDCSAPHSSAAAAAASSSDQVMILPPTAELQRGKIYFLMPVTSSSSAAAAAERRRRRKKEAEKNNNYHNIYHHINFNNNNNNSNNSSSSSSNNNNNNNNEKARDKMMVVLNERYLSEILSEKASTQRDRRRGRVGVWRPHLESISEADF